MMDEIARPVQTAEPVGNAQCCEPEVYNKFLSRENRFSPSGVAAGTFFRYDRGKKGSQEETPWMNWNLPSG